MVFLKDLYLAAYWKFRCVVLQAVIRLMEMFGKRYLNAGQSLRLLEREGERVATGIFRFCTGKSRGLRILHSGHVAVDRNTVLQLDYNSHNAMIGGSGKEPSCRVKRAVPLWSHRWQTGGFYHFTIDVLPRICRMKECFPDEMDSFTFCYPTLKTTYEAEYLELLGVGSGQIMDTTQARSIECEEVFCLPHPGRYNGLHSYTRLAREEILSKVDLSGLEQSRPIYLSRRASMRHCLNEDRVMAVLEQRGFVIVDPMPERVVDQIRLFHAASLVLSVHGAALTNIFWCQPSTPVIEFVNPGYKDQGYRNLTAYLNLPYFSIPDPRYAPSRPHNWLNRGEDILADIEHLERLLDSLDRLGRF